MLFSRWTLCYTDFSLLSIHSRHKKVEKQSRNLGLGKIPYVFLNVEKEGALIQVPVNILKAFPLKKIFLTFSRVKGENEGQYVD